MVSIITPNFNSHQYIVETYHSLLAQTYSNWEWLVVDDGSTDNSPELIKQLALSDHRIKFYVRDSENKGASVCRNLGIKKSMGDYIIFLDADDLLAPYCLKQRIRCLLQNPELDFAVFNMGYFNNRIGDKEGCVNQYYNDNTKYLRSFIAYNIPWAITCPIWKSSFIKNNYILFSENYQRLQDPEFHAKILLKYEPKFKVVKESPVDCYYRQSQNNTTAIKQQSFENIVNGFIYYIIEIKTIAGVKQYQHEIKAFIRNSFHALLFMHHLSPKTNPILYYNKLKNAGFKIPLSKSSIKFFYYMNLLRLTFVKGAGVSKLWSFIIKQ